MKNLKLCLKALYLCIKLHYKQRDKAGKRYFYHPIEVALKVKGLRAKTIALLHDVLEDTDFTVGNMIQAGFTEHTINGVKVLTKKPKESYDKYIKRIKEANHMDALQVKIADLKHNMTLSRLPFISEKDLQRCRKYGNAVTFLKGGNK